MKLPFDIRISMLLAHGLSILASALLPLALPAASFRLAEPIPQEIRPLPFQAGQANTVIDAASFGAIPNDGRDDAPAIREAIEAAIAKGGLVEVRLAPGRYDLLEPAPGSRYFVVIQGAQDLLLNGSGAEWIAREPASGIFRIEDSQRVEVRHLTIDYDPLPWTEGTVVSLGPDSESLVMAVRPGFPAPDATYFEESLFWGYALDPDVPGRLKFGTESHTFFAPPAKALGERQYRLRFAEAYRAHAKTLSPGDRLTVLARNEGAYIAFVENTSQTTFTNITSYASVSGHYVGVRADAVNILGCRALIREGRWKGGNADAVHIQTARVGPWVEDCHFEGISDDSLVVYTRPYSIEKILSPAELLLNRLSFGGRQRGPIPAWELRSGDVLDFFDPNTDAGYVLNSATVKNFDSKSGRVTLVDRLPSMGNLKKAGPAPIQIFNRAHGQGYVMRNNLVRNSRRYGLYVKAGNGLVSGNRFEGLSSSAIAVFNEPAAPNGGFAHGLILADNHIVRCGFSAQYLRKSETGSFSIYAKKLPFYMAGSGTAHSEITVKDNRVEEWIHRPYYLGNIDGLNASGNTWGLPRKVSAYPPGDGLFRIVSCENVTARQNGAAVEDLQKE